MLVRLQKFNDWLEPRVAVARRTINNATGWIPVQVRRFIRLAAMTAAADYLLERFGVDLSGWADRLSTAAAVGAQEVAHRTIAPATPDREFRE